MNGSLATAEVRTVVCACREVLASAGTITLDDDYFYASLPLCVIDAVFSIGVKYGSVRNVVERYCERFGVPKLARDRSGPPPVAEQESVSAFLARIRDMDAATLAADVFENRQRTSSRNGILKAEAVRRFAEVLARHSIEHLQDVLGARDVSAVERDVRLIPGQGSGVSWSYFLMLAGREDLVKPDRMILRFLERSLGRPVAVAEAQALLAAATRELGTAHPGLKVRTLDNVIWKQESARAARAVGASCRSL
jgi:hypothetical protein